MNKFGSVYYIHQAAEQLSFELVVMRSMKNTTSYKVARSTASARSPANDQFVLHHEPATQACTAPPLPSHGLSTLMKRVNSRLK